MSFTHTDRLAELVDCKYEVLQRLHQLSRRQQAVVENGETNDLLAILAAKQTLLENMQAVDGRLAPFRDDDPDARVWRSAGDRARCRRVAEASRALLDEIMEMEQRDEAAMRGRRDRLARRLETAHDATQARSAYMQTGGAGVHQLDLTSES